MQKSGMNMIKNPTPGPWSIDGRAAGGNLDIVAPSGRITMMDCERDDDALVTADARLIAAAPDLLVALRELVADNMGHPKGVTVPQLDKARAAIRKATEEG